MEATSNIDYKVLYEQAQVTIAMLKHRIDQLEKMVFGSKHERFVTPSAPPQQLSLDIQADNGSFLQCYRSKAGKLYQNKSCH